MNLIDGNRITLLKNGAAFFPALEAAIDAARIDIRVETYIFAEDASGIRIANTLMRAVSRGVTVSVLVDGIGSRETAMSFFDSLRAAGVQVAFFRPDHDRYDFHKSRIRRTHRKIVLIDGCVGLIGGINLVGDFTDNFSATHPRYDYAVKIEGAILAEIYPSVARLWRAATWFGLKSGLRNRRPHRPHHPLPAVATRKIDEAALAFVMRDNFRHRRDIEREYWRAIVNAKKEILLVCPYFLPGRALRKALMKAAGRGVNVHVLLQGIADHPLMQLATHALYDQLLAAGVNIYEYQPAMLHGKVAVVDGRWATVGSSNLDPFSLLLNREANVIALDETFATSLYASVMDEIKGNALQLNLSSWQQRGLWLRMKSWVAFGLTRWVLGLVGVRRD